MVSQVMAALREVGYVCSELLAAQIALLLTTGKQLRVMLLDGPPGSGKTFLAKSVARMMGVDYIYIQAHPGSSPEDFLFDANIVSILRSVSGDKEAVKGPEDVIDFGFLPTLFQLSQERKVVGFVDELDKAAPKCDSFFLAALQEKEVVVKGLGRIKANPDNLVLFFTKNDERQVSEPLMRRCRREYMTFPSPELEIDVLTGAVQESEGTNAYLMDPEIIEGIPTPLAKTLVTYANNIRNKAPNMIKVPATQELFMAGCDVLKLAAWKNLNLSGQIVFKWLAAYKEDQDLLANTGIVNVPGLTANLTSAIRASGDVQKKRNPVSLDDSFVKF